jgi:glutamate-ammonia-ligase adenylyltransferase
VARNAPESDARLYPIGIDVDNDISSEFTVLRIRSTDTLGFLFEFSNALTALNMLIERVDIRTLDHEVCDTFWVVDLNRHKIVEPNRIHELRVAAALIKQFTHLLPHSSDPAQALRQFRALTGQMLSRPDWTRDVQCLQSDEVMRTLAEMMGVSQFLWEDFLRVQHENLFPVLRDFPALDESRSKQRLREELENELSGCRGAAEPAKRLNQFKDREMFRIDLRHITRRIGLIEFSDELSDLAEVIVEQTCCLGHQQLQSRFGSPLLVGGRPCAWCVCALGKFGGREMGYASDVELVFVYEREGHTGGGTPIDNSRYFEEWVALFLQTLVSRREGIFEIDLRLRPHGKAGSLACSLEGFARYYCDSGPAEQFERLALVKLRPVAGVAGFADRVVQARDAFVYCPKPVNYDNIVHLRHRQAAELVSANSISAKHSLGGLTDIEYFVQAKQIEAGGRNPNVRTTNTLEAISRLHQYGSLSPTLAEKLALAYRFLRRLIEALRVVHGQAKDLTIPPRDSRDFAHLARRLDYDSAFPLQTDIQRHMSFARQLWSSACSRSPASGCSGSSG